MLPAHHPGRPLGRRPARVRDSGREAGKPQGLVGQVMRVARMAGHTVVRDSAAAREDGAAVWARAGGGAAFAFRSTQGRVVIKARVVRQRGARFRSAALARHLKLSVARRRHP